MSGQSLQSDITDEAVKVALDELSDDGHNGIDCRPTRDFGVSVRAALEAAAPLLGPRPLLDREAVERAIATKIMYYDSSTAVHEVDDNDLAALVAGVDAVMELARPMPTREQIVEVLARQFFRWDEDRLDASLDELSGGDRDAYRTTAEGFADAVLALLNGAES